MEKSHEYNNISITTTGVSVTQEKGAEKVGTPVNYRIFRTHTIQGETCRLRINFRVMSSQILGEQCAAQSVGTFNTMVNTLLQTLLAAQCAISPPELWPPDYADEALKNGLDTYDFVVVGAGSAGSVLASRLSENQNWKVLVLEAGGDPPQESEIPTLIFAMERTAVTWDYLTEYSETSCWAFRDRRCYWPRGKMIGGSGAVNAMLHVRGNRRNFDGWAQAGNTGWGWDDVLPYFERSLQPLGNDTHPQGYLTLSRIAAEDKVIGEMIYKGTEELGIPRVYEFTEGSYIGYSNLPLTLSNGRRMSTGKSFLAKVAQRPNLHVLKNALVTKLNFDEFGKRVSSVSFKLRDEYEMTAKVGRELVLTAGSIESPKLLLLSGVGPAQQLKALKVPLIHDLPVGENLIDHVQVLLFIKLNEQVSASPKSTPLDDLDSTYNYLIHRVGPLAHLGTASITGFINTLNDGPYPDIEYQHFYLRHGAFGSLQIFVDGFNFQADFKAQLHKVLATADLLIVNPTLSNPKSTGRLQLNSTDYKHPPKLIHNYFSVPEDTATLLRAIRFQEQLVKTAAYNSLNASLVLLKIDECDALVTQSDDYWRCYIKYFSCTIYHQSGTVKMAPETDATSCVNPRLRLRGVDNLRC